MANAIANYVVFLGSDLRVKSPRRLQILVDSAIRYGEFILVQAQNVGAAASPDRASAYTGSSPFLFGGSVQQCQGIADDLAAQMVRLRRRLPRPLIWIVEGESEEHFFKALLRAHHGADFVGTRLVSMQG